MLGLAIVFNMITGIVERFRWPLLGQAEGFTPLSMSISLGVTGLLLFGIRYFRQTELTFADVI